jgi:signal transduction histidine kinase
MGRAAFSIRSRWFFLMGVVASAVIFASIVVAVVVARFHMYAIGSQEALTRAQAFAYRAGFAVLVGADDRETVDAFLIEVSQTPGVLAVQLVRADQTSLGVREVQGGSLRNCRFSEAGGAASSTLVGTAWCVVAPISIGESNADRQRVVGELRVVTSIEAAQSVVQRMAAWLVVTGVLLLWIAWFVIWRSAAGITRALVSVMHTMQQFGPGRVAPQAEVSGPQEVQTIARVYNGLLEGIVQHEQRLEEQVRVRTRELNEALERIKNAERYKSTFMATVSHEMKTPLHVVASHACEVLSELEFLTGAGTAREHVEVIMRVTDELAATLAQILDLSRAESTHSDLVFVDVDLQKFAADVREKAEPLAKRYGNKLSFAVSKDIVQNDVDVMRQIVTNLVTNACKFTDGGEVRVSIDVVGAELRVKVSDTGRGIPQHALNRIFEEFWQVDSGEGRRVGGFGLGLAIVKRCVNRLGGTIDVQSEVGKGTTVLVRIPIFAHTVAGAEVREAS